MQSWPGTKNSKGFGKTHLSLMSQLPIQITGQVRRSGPLLSLVTVGRFHHF